MLVSGIQQSDSVIYLYVYVYCFRFFSIIGFVVVQSPIPVRLCDLMDCSTLGLPVPHHLPEFAQVHVHCISDAIKTSHPLMPSFPSALDLSQHHFPMSHLFASDDQNIGVSASASVLPVSIQGYFPFRLAGLISLLSRGLSGVFSSITDRRHQFFGVCLVYGPSLTTVCDHWEDHSLVYIYGPLSAE